MADEEIIKAGLEDVMASESALSFVDGIEGELIYRGYHVHDLATHCTFEEVTYLLWKGELPTTEQLAAFNIEMNANRALPDEALALIAAFPKHVPAMAGLRTAVSLLSFFDPDAGDNSYEANTRKALRLTAQMGTIVAAIARHNAGKPVLAPLPDRRTAANFLYMLNGLEPRAEFEHALDVALILHADHEFNASTFSARVTISTLSDMYSAVTSAIGTLAGPLHGGANEVVMHTLEQIGDPDKAEAFVEATLAAGKRIMGIGHRVYRTIDPRVLSLREMSRQLAEVTGDDKWFRISEAVELASDKALTARGKTKLKPNVDFYSASVYRMLGIPTEQFTPVFAMSRIAGWTAHLMEQLKNNRLIRPRARYVGHPRRAVEPIAARRPAPRTEVQG